MTDSLAEEISKRPLYILTKVPTLYKYLDCKGTRAMLSNSNLLFKNPYFYNDPYDCYIGLIDFDNIPENYRQNLHSKFSDELKSSELVLKILNVIPDKEMSRMYKEII